MQYFSLKVLLITGLFCWVAGEPQWYNATDGRQYLLETEQKYNWFSAWNECARQNLQLLVIESSEKNQIITDLLTEVIGEPIDVWLAAHDTLNTGTTSRQFYWLPTGEKMSFSYWGPNEPNNDFENCLQIRSTYPEYLWNDKECLVEFGYICEENSFQRKYKKNLNEKQLSVAQKYEALKDNYQMQQRHINLLNSKADFEIEMLSFYLKRDVEQMQITTNQRIEEIHAQRKEAINSWVSRFTNELESNRDEVQEILNDGHKN